MIPSFLGWLGLLLIGLKLTHIIDWSWWWVTAPVWGGMALVVVVTVTVSMVMELLEWKARK